MLERDRTVVLAFYWLVLCSIIYKLFLIKDVPPFTSCLLDVNAFIYFVVYCIWFLASNAASPNTTCSREWPRIRREGPIQSEARLFQCVRVITAGVGIAVTLLSSPTPMRCKSLGISGYALLRSDEHLRPASVVSAAGYSLTPLSAVL